MRTQEMEEKKNINISEAEKLGLDEASFNRMQEEMRRRKAEEEARKITPKKILNIFYLGIFLFFVCTFATVVMGYIEQLTKEPRIRAKKERLNGMLKEILPVFDNDIISTEKSVSLKKGAGEAKIYTAKKAGKIAAYAVSVYTLKAYGGKMEALVSFSPEGKIYSFVVSGHSETPGLGSVVAERKEKKTFSTLFAEKKTRPFPYNLPPGAVLDQFRGRSVKEAPWRLRNMGGDIDGRSGATITSAAVTLLASRAAEALKEMWKQEGK